MPKKQKDTNYDLRWLVENRSAIEKRMLELYELGGEMRGHGTYDYFWPVYGLLVGVVFSLWRSVFLIQKERSAKDEMSHGDEVLRILVETNAIGFSQDKETAQWMAGYYINNAVMRLHSVDDLPRMKEILAASPPPMSRLELRDIEDSLGLPLHDSWQRALAVYDYFVAQLAARSALRKADELLG